MRQSAILKLLFYSSLLWSCRSPNSSQIDPRYKEKKNQTHEKSFHQVAFKGPAVKALAGSWSDRTDCLEIHSDDSLYWKSKKYQYTATHSEPNKYILSLSLNGNKEQLDIITQGKTLIVLGQTLKKVKQCPKK